MTNMLRPADIYVLLGVAAHDDGAFTYRELASELGIPHAQVQRSLDRAAAAGLYLSDRHDVHRANLEEFLIHALRYIAPASLGAVAAGVPAAWATEPLSARISGDDDLPPVWPSAHGHVRGRSLEPLHPAAVDAVHKSLQLAHLLSLADALRAGDARIRREAKDLLPAELRRSAPAGQRKR